MQCTGRSQVRSFENMVRQPILISYSTSENMKKGAWSREEDQKLAAYIGRYRIWNWNHMARAAGLARSGKSCRLRWMNYLKPGLKHGNFTKEEEDIILKWHQILGNKWSTIASKLVGRTDNEIKNCWHTRLKKRSRKQMQDGNKTDHSESLPQVVSNEDTTPNSESEQGSLLDYTTEDGTSTENTDVFVETSSGIAAAAELRDFWKQLADLPSVVDILQEDGFGDTSSMVSGRFNLPPYPPQQTIPIGYLIYDLWN